MSEFSQDITTGFGLALVAYVATNIDNFLVLTGLAANATRSRPVVVGFSVAATLVLALVASFSFLSYLVPVGSLGYLGIVPIAIGLRLLVAANAGSAAAAPTRITAAAVFAVLAVNSMDTVVTFGSLVAESKSVVRVALIAGYIVAASIMIWMVFHVSRSVDKLFAGNKYVRLLAPIVMIGVGFYVLTNTWTDLEFGP